MGRAVNVDGPPLLVSPPCLAAARTGRALRPYFGRLMGCRIEQRRLISVPRRAMRATTSCGSRRPQAVTLSTPGVAGRWPISRVIAFTPGGERIFTTTFFQHPGGGRRDGLIHAVYGGVYGKVHAVIDGHTRTGPDVMPVLTHLGPAAGPRRRTAAASPDWPAPGPGARRRPPRPRP